MADVALLAPVPIEHLRSAVGNSKSNGRAIFSTDRGETLEKLVKLSGEQTTKVYIYASGTSIKGRVTWCATFEGIRDQPNSEYRPGSTKTDTKSDSYYEVSDLRQLPEDQWIPIERFSGHGKPGHYASNYNPRRPTLV